MKSSKPEKSRNHEERFRCPQCGRMVTVRAGFRREDGEHEAMVRFECTMEGMCGSPVWDPCPMYVAYMEGPPKPKPPADPKPGESVDDAW